MSSRPLDANRKWLCLAVICLCFLPVSIDATILYVAIPPLVAALHADATQLLWIVDIYPFVTAGLVLITGPLGDRFGHQRILLAGLSVFGLASLWAAFAGSPEMLIAARALKGAGGAMIVPSTLALIRILLDDPRERAIGIGLWGALASVGAASGPPLGGLLLEHFWWGSVFLVNIPVVLLLAPLVVTLIPNRAFGLAHRIDYWAPFLALTGVLAVTFALKQAAHGAFLTFVPVASALYGIAALAFFVRRELAASHPLLDLRLFAIPAFRLAVAIAIGCSLVLIGFELLLAQYLQMVLGLSALAAGLVVLPFPISGILFGPIGGYLNDRVSTMFTAALGLALSASGYLLLLVIDIAALSLPLLLLIGLIGAGHALTMAAATNGIMASAPEARAGAAAGIESVSFELGSGFGVAIFGSVMTATYLGRFIAPAGLPRDPGQSIGEALALAAELGSAQALSLRDAAATAYLDGFRLVIALSAGVLAALFLVIAIRRRRVPAGG